MLEHVQSEPNKENLRGLIDDGGDLLTVVEEVINLAPEAKPKVEPKAAGTAEAAVSEKKSPKEAAVKESVKKQAIFTLTQGAGVLSAASKVLNVVVAAKEEQGSVDEKEKENETKKTEKSFIETKTGKVLKGIVEAVFGVLAVTLVSAFIACVAVLIALAGVAFAMIVLVVAGSYAVLSGLSSCLAGLLGTDSLMDSTMALIRRLTPESKDEPIPIEGEDVITPTEANLDEARAKLVIEGEIEEPFGKDAEGKKEDKGGDV